MTTSRPTQCVASSLDAGSRQRWQTIVKIARSTPERPRPEPATLAIALPIPSCVHSSPTTCGPPHSGAARKSKPCGAPGAQAVLAAEEALDRAHQPDQRVAVEQVLAAEV